MEKYLENPIEKRDLIYDDDTQPETLKKAGDLFFDEGYFSDALKAYINGDLKEGGKKIRNKAQKQGNFFLLRQIRENWDDLISGEVWEKAGDNAMENGRYIDAVKLYYAAGQTGKMNEAEEKVIEETGKPVPAVVRKDSADAKEKT